MAAPQPFCKSSGVSRRSFVVGSALAAGGTMAAISLSGCSSGKDEKPKQTGEPQVITDDSKIVNVTEEFRERRQSDRRPVCLGPAPRNGAVSL